MFSVYVLELEVGKGQEFSSSVEGVFSTPIRAQEGARILVGEGETLEWEQLSTNVWRCALLPATTRWHPVLKIRSFTVDPSIMSLTTAHAYFSWTHDDLVNERAEILKVPQSAGAAVSIVAPSVDQPVTEARREPVEFGRREG